MNPETSKKLAVCLIYVYLYKIIAVIGVLPRKITVGEGQPKNKITRGGGMKENLADPSHV